MALRFQAVCVDCSDPRTLGAWWAEVLGWLMTHVEDDEVVLEPTEGSAEDGVTADIPFLKVPEAKTVKNRLYIDLRPDDQTAEVMRLEALGARRTDVGQGTDVSWVLMADPEGNEFCVLRALGQRSSRAGERQEPLALVVY